MDLPRLAASLGRTLRSDYGLLCLVDGRLLVPFAFTIDVSECSSGAFISLSMLWDVEIYIIVLLLIRLLKQIVLRTVTVTQQNVPDQGPLER